jgi:thiamine biosynthesis protein ThiS
LAPPRLLLVSDSQRARLPLLDLAAAAVAGGVDAIYLRDVQERGDDLGRLVARLRARVGDGVAVMVNGGPETARLAGAGLHLRDGELSPREARAHLGPGLPIGQSVHAAAGAAKATGADYVLAGHVFPSLSKPGRKPLGVAGLATITAAAPCPVLAIGGIVADRVAAVVRAGAAGIAVIGAIAAADDPETAAAELRHVLDQALAAKERSTMQPQQETEVAVRIVVNGKERTIPSGATIHDLLASNRLTDAMAIVERNGEIVPRPQYAAITLQTGDSLEIVHAVGGG